MRAINLGTASYAPVDPPSDPAQLQGWLREETAKLAAAINALALGHLDLTRAAPLKPRDGDMRYADGAGWDPGAGKGLYMHNGSVWTLIKAIP